MYINKIPLALRIIALLLATQLICLPLGGFYLINRVQSTRHEELVSLLENEGELIESSLEIAKGKLKDFVEHDHVHDMNENLNAFFWLLRSDGTLVYESGGIDEATRNLIKNNVAMSVNASKNPLFPSTFEVDDQKWLVTRQRPDKAVRQKDFAHARDLYITMNVTTSMQELESIKKDIVWVTLLMCAFSCFGVVAVVSVSTRNMRQFTREISQINPNNPKWTFGVKANSLEESQLFSAFKSLIEKIAQSKESQRLFIANASHELKTPIAGILSAMEVFLAKRRSIDDAVATCQGVLETARDMKRMTNTLLDLAAFEHKEYPTESVDILAIIKRLASKWKPTAEEKNISLTIKNENILEVIDVQAHAELMEVAIGNFIDNAIKYSQGGSMVELSVWRDDKFAHILIKDQGHGMSERAQRQLGDFFYMADKSHSDVASYGLGFAQAKKIIETFGGNVAVVSKKGEGTAITISLNLKK